jgi:RHH-type transcriptional regulator, proline utilization regulon repressor / proline dehydrogenase / delta 1-pyrroline-5-carboxylate dehydrogenase
MSLPEQQRLPEPYRAENACVADLAATLGAVQAEWPAVIQQAAPWVEQVRNNPPAFWAMESLLREYPITRPEGLALMRLAEALLRVPDAETAIALTADQLGRADFDSAGDGPHKMLSSLSAAAISLSKKFLPGEDSGGLMGRLGSKTVVGATVRAIQLLGRQFVLGRNIDEAQNEAASARKEIRTLTFSYDMLGEGARTEHDAERYLASYANAIARIAARGRASSPMAGDGISIKLSALFTRYEVLQRERVFATLVPRVQGLVDAAAAANMNLTIDAEEVDRLELSLDVFEALAQHIAKAHPQWQGFGLAVQAYQTRALAVVNEVAAIAKRHGLKFMVRLVKGAYWDGEIKRAQELGLSDYPVFTAKAHTDVSYLACAQALIGHKDVIYPQFASHNAGTIAAIVRMARAAAAPFEMQRLHGMGEGIYREVLKDSTIPCRVYAPVGEHRDLLAYLVRRLLENGANSSFVHQLADPSVAVPELLGCPLDGIRRTLSLPLPADLYRAAGETRANSTGADLAAPTQRAPLVAAVAACAAAGVPAVPLASSDDVQAAMQRLHQGVPAWSATPVAQRASVLRTAADRLDAALPAYCALLVKEAHKTLADTIAEVREAVDFLRYYADEAEAAGDRAMQGRGVFVCISPWNFPLAIFVGQVAAALVAGNTVAAKPAEQTPAVAAACVQLLFDAGVPLDALALLNGTGETVGAALVAHPLTAGVCFTGSTQVAKIIQKTLAASGANKVLIAETGGLNAMVVDSTALPEQVVDAVVQSAFRSAGQRCSALRLLCVHSSIADGVIEMIQGALAELRVGDPANLATDVGPLIDAEAFAGISANVERLKREAKLLAEGGLHDGDGPNAVPNLVRPVAFEVRSLTELKTEIFGPVLHVLRWSGAPEAVIEQINGLGYGLTLGIQTRIDSRAEALADAARIGNVYVNRNIIGAVVGVQPFGGEGLSGTGPKAGGPNYLWRFVQPATVPSRAASAGALPDALAARLRSLQAAMPDQAGLLAQAAPRLLERALPGPTGERNELRLHPRGHVVGFVAQADGAAWRSALALALLAGNQVTLVGEQSALAGACALRQQFQSQGNANWLACQDHAPAAWPQWVQRAALDAAFSAGLSSAQLGLLLQALAARSGAIVTLVTEQDAAQPQQAYRFVAEQTLTVNTAAAGGNAALLAGL